MINKKLIGIGITLICISLLMLTGTAQADIGSYEDTFQNHPDDLITNANLNNLSWTLTADDPGDCGIKQGWAEVFGEGDSDKKFYYMHIDGNQHASIKTNEAHYMKYISWNQSYFKIPTDIGTPYINFSFYGIDNNLLGHTDNLYAEFDRANNPSHHFELKHVDNKVYLYKDGGTPPTDTGVTFTENIYYFKLYIKNGGAGTAIDCWIDDFSTQGDVIGGIPQNWYIRRDIANEALSGLYDQSNTLVYEDIMHTSYTYKIIAGEPATSIKLYYISGGNKTYINTEAIHTEHFGIITYNFDDLLMNADYRNDLFGNYQLEMYRGADLLTFDSFSYTYITSGIFSGTVSLDKEKYVASETAVITTSLTGEDFDTYDFVLNVTSMDAETVYAENITSNSQVVNWDSTGVSTNKYYAELVAIRESDGFKWILAFDTCIVTQKVAVSGTTYNAYNGSTLASVDVNYLQDPDYYNASSDVLGEYNVGEISTAISTSINASKADYVHDNFIITFTASGLQDVDLWLLPDASNLPHSDTTIAGLVQMSPFHQPISGATVTIWNGTGWSNSTTTTDSGYYYFENLGHGTYWMNSSAGWYSTSDNEQVTTNDGTVKYQYFLLEPLYSLIINAKNVDTLMTIAEFGVVVDNGAQTCTATTGSCTVYNLAYGTHKIETSAAGFYGVIEYANVYGNTNHTSYLIAVEEGVTGGPGVYYAPRSIEFRIQDYYGNSISDVIITAYGVETTMGAWNWLTNFLGFTNESAAEIQNTSMNGTTDSMGSLSFMMVETIKYKITFVKESAGIDETMYFYPKESQYLIVLSSKAKEMMIDYVNWNLSVEEIIGEDSNRSLNLTYSDTMSKTSQLCFFVRDENRTEIYSTCFTDDPTVDIGYKVAKSSGVTYFWGFNCTHDTFGDIDGTKAVTFKGRLIELGINPIYYPWVSIAFLVLITSLFSSVTVKFGYVILPLLSAFFVAIGWLEIAPTLITVIVILGIILYMGKRERETGL